MFAITHRCARCGELVDFTVRACLSFSAVKAENLAKAKTPEIQPTTMFTTGTDVDLASAAALAQCPRCNCPSMIEFSLPRQYLRAAILAVGKTESVADLASRMTVGAVFPTFAEPDSDPHWPSEVRRHFEDAQRMLSARMTPSIIIGVCRTVLDVVTKKLGADQDSLYRRIDHLRTAGTITEPLADWAHALRLDGNTAVHEGIGEENEAVEFVAFLKTLLNVAFTLPARIAEKRASGVE
ncbi:DUF4145 domain-containing protein [Mesorhizobium sp. M0808]|uniref:DUF4145 domain-containing protein n=1 Tax=Mesorhizobium sp. M0808 TaxID=2957002 RepID=UPI00333C815B